MKTLYIVRHGQTEWNVAGRMQGRLDSPLTALGREQATQNGALLHRLGGVDALWVSPAGRTRETAQLLNQHTNAPMNMAEELVERDCGDWSGMTLGEIQARYPQSWAERQRRPFTHQPPNGENMQDIHDRSHKFLQALLESKHDVIGLITHGVMSKVILKYFLSLPEQESVEISHPNDLVYRLTITAQDVETHHFVAGGEARSGLHHVLG